MRYILVVLVPFALLGTLCFGQTVSPKTTDFEGTTSDATGAVVAGATVTVKDAAGETRAVVTDGTGKFRFAGLPVGPTEVVVTAPGFADFKSEGFSLTVGEPNSLDVQLQPASAATQVNVEGQRANQIETENAEVSGTIAQKEIVSYGLNGRNFSTLIALAPGVSNQTGQDEAKVGVVGSAKYSVNGGRTEYNTFDVDGSDVLNTDIAASHGHSTLLVYPSLDAIQEMKVLTSNYGAQYGRSASGTVLVTTKSGGSHFHGNAYEFLRNEVFNARNYFDGPGKAPLYRRNDFGGTLGGPIFIPNFYNVNKDKTFFFISSEFRKERSPIQYNQGVPSDAERGFNPITQSAAGLADFSDVCPTPDNDPFYTDDFFNGFYRTTDKSVNTQRHPAFPDCPGQFHSGTVGRYSLPYVNGVPNAVIVDPAAQAILNTGLIPRANSTTGCNSSINSCYVSTVSPPTDYREDLLRIDHNFTAGEKLSFHGIHDHWETTTAVPQWAGVVNSFPSVLNDFQGPGVSVVTNLTSIFSPSLLNQFSIGGTWQKIALADLPGKGVALDRSGLNALQYPIGYLFNNGFGGKLPGIVINGNNAAYGGAGFAVDTSYMPWHHTLTTESLRDDLTKVFGKHSLQFGVQYVRAKRTEVGAVNGANTGDVQGQLIFSNVATSRSTGNAFADFLYNSLGVSYNPILGGGIQYFQQDTAQGQYTVKYWVVEPYVQDDWHVTRRLTLNLGVRFSLFGNWEPVGQTLYNWVPSAYSSSPYDPNSANPIAIFPEFGDFYSVKPPSVPIRFDPNNVLNTPLTNGLVKCGTNGVPASCQSSHIFNPSPRLGFAWDPTGSGKTSIRGGYGMFYEHGTGSEANAGSLMGNPPQVVSMSQYGPTSWHCIGFNGAGCGPFSNETFPLNMVSIPSKNTWPYVQQWSFGVQHELARGTAMTLSYVGSKGTHLAAAMQINQLKPVSNANNPFGPNQPITVNMCGPNASAIAQPPYQFNYFTFPDGTQVRYSDNPSAFLALAAACDGTPAGDFPAISFSVNAIRPYYGLGNILAINNVASSVYHSMQFTLHHNHGPVDLGISYTYGHSIDSASDRFESSFVDAYDLAANRASSDFDQRHLVNLSYVYQLPLLRVLEKFRKGLNCDDVDTANHNTDCANARLLSPFSPSKLTRHLVDGWALSGITLFQTGTPFSVINGSSSTGISVPDNAGLALGTGADSYPDVTQAASCHFASSGTFGPLLASPCMFVAPRGLTQGNAGRNFMNNPNRMNFDMALLKTTRLWNEASSVEFRVEAFNVFNQTQFVIYDPVKGNTTSNVISCYGDSSTNYSAGAPSCRNGNGFLHPVEAHRPRTMQFGLKLQF